MNSSLKLPFSFDPESLRSDLNQIKSEEWVAHFNQGYFEGDWAGMALRSTSGQAGQLFPDPRAEGSFTDTAVLERCPNIQAILSLFKCPLRAVRFLRLTAGSNILEHRDYDLGYEVGQVRLHIPIETNADVVFVLDARQVEMREGECWYLDLSLPHWVENRGVTDRVHLVIDCEANEWLRELMTTAQAADAEMRPAAPALEECASAPAEFERFRHAVCLDLKLQQSLRATRDRECFGRLVVSVGRDAGYRFNLQDVETALRAARRSWIERWVN